jgi:hypothetical protein
MSHPDYLYDDYDDFHEDDMELYDHEDEFDDFEDDDSMDGDAESSFGSCGWGVDEYYNSDTPMYDDYYGGE